MNLIFLSMQQDRAAPAASIIHTMITRVKYWRSLQKDAGFRCDDYFKADLTGGHNVLLGAGGSTTELSATDA